MSQDPAGKSAHLYHFTHSKAGTNLSSDEKKHVNKVIYEMSKNSRYFKNAQRNDKKTIEKIEEIRRQKESLISRDFAAVRLEIKKQRRAIEKTVNFEKGIFAVVDMDMFYAAVEIRDNPSYKDVPIAVGCMAMISTTNYVARKYGVRSAMPGFIAKKICPELVFVPLNHAKYSAASAVVMDILKKYDENLFNVSQDEAYLNITKLVLEELKKDASRTKEDIAGSIVLRMRKEVFETTKLTCSAGIGATSMIAKVASDKNKPDGQFCVPFNTKAVLSFVRGLKVRRVPGIGKVTEKLLHDGFEIATVQDIGHNLEYIFKLLTPTTASYLLRVYLGASGSSMSFQPDSSGRKSLSVERTFGRVIGFAQMCKILLEISDKLVQDLQVECLMGRVLTLKVKYCDFKVRNKQIKLRTPVGNDAKQIHNIAITLLKELNPKDVRLLGLKVSDFVKAATLTGSKRERQLFINGVKQKQTEKACPVCLAKLQNMSNSDINDHIDSCLRPTKNLRKNDSSNIPVIDLT